MALQFEAAAAALMAEEEEEAAGQDEWDTDCEHQGGATTSCSACGGKNHSWGECRYKGFVCWLCKKVGHLRQVCPEWTEPQGSLRPRHEAPPASLPRVKYFTHSGETRYSENQSLFNLSVTKYKPLKVPVKIQRNILLEMEVDTGSAVSCINKQAYTTLFSDLPLQPASICIRLYNGSREDPMGVLDVNVEYGRFNKTLQLYVFRTGIGYLLGRQWLAELEIMIPKFTAQHEIFGCNTLWDNEYDMIEDLCFKLKDMLTGEVGKFTGGKARYRLRKCAKPVYQRASPLPSVLRRRVDAGLDAMLTAGIIEPVEESCWASTMVAVAKSNGTITLCADFKTVLNQYLRIESYTVRRISDLFLKLCKNKYFSKLDLSEEYNQIELMEQSTALTVINTHRGLYKYKRLVTGLPSSSGIFQRIMKNLFNDLPNVTVFFDDILVTTSTAEENIEILDNVFQILNDNGMKLKRQNCTFLAKEVNYLGFIIDELGIRAEPDKLKPILDLTPPANESQMKFFTDMASYYGQFIKNINECLLPLQNISESFDYLAWDSGLSKSFDEAKELLRRVQLPSYHEAIETIMEQRASGKSTRRPTYEDLYANITSKLSKL